VDRGRATAAAARFKAVRGIQLALRPRVLDERLAGLLAARRGGGLATAGRSESMLRRSASIRLMTFCDDG
jgi:hypothetical protein